MSKSTENHSDFCVFILTHGRPDKVYTYETLKKSGYEGPLFLVIDNEDKTADRYVEKFGADSVIVFGTSPKSDAWKDISDLAAAIEILGCRMRRQGHDRRVLPARALAHRLGEQRQLAALARAQVGDLVELVEQRLALGLELLDVATVLGHALARALGKIDRPTSNAGQTPPDEGDRNWLNIRFTAAWRGNIWKITRSWMLSGPGGWNPDVYRYK